ncbi:MAG: DEAD/DEAH box helicase [Caldilinea sp.]
MDEYKLIKACLPRTWSPFFARHGNFTPAQAAAIPLLLAGQNVMLCAPTASGKTEAALAPLIERYLAPERQTMQLTLLYLLPTRALVNDIAGRLTAPLDRLRVRLAVKTRDRDDFDPRRPASILLTTPESLDALLARRPKALTQVRGVVIDELHVLDGDVRGDQLRVLLARLRQVRTFAAQQGDASDAAVQYVALSATVAAPESAAARYFPDARVVVVPGGRSQQISLRAMAAESAEALLALLEEFQALGWRKALVFCNTRAEVELYATAVRRMGSPFGQQVYVHYSNLDRLRRREIEEQFAQADAAICFASSTLELGVDIGTIDVAVQIGAPGSAAAFVQRIGRAGRRRQTIQAVCFFRSPLEEALLRALLAAPEPVPTRAPFRASVAVQQIFSLLLQSPTGAIRLASLSLLFEGVMAESELAALLGALQEMRYLQSARVGEWRAGERLNRLVDQQSSEHAPMSLYSNIQNRPPTVKIRDQNSQQIVAAVDPLWLDRELLTLEGRSLDVTWFDGEALWVTRGGTQGEQSRLPFLSSRQLLSFELAQQLALQVGMGMGEAPLLETAEGWLLFHWLGDVYGHLLLALLRPHLAVRESVQPGLALLLGEEPRALPSIGGEQVERFLYAQVRQYEGMLALGAYAHLLPYASRQQAVAAQFDVPRFVEGVSRLALCAAPEQVREELAALLYKSDCQCSR